MSHNMPMGMIIPQGATFIPLPEPPKKDEKKDKKKGSRKSKKKKSKWSNFTFWQVAGILGILSYPVGAAHYFVSLSLDRWIKSMAAGLLP